ncbi:MAG: NAD(P)/FAD-dependent oxidoreductase [Chlamydiota bacterium]
MEYDFVVVGGGAAGIFAALTAKATHPEWNVVVLEKTAVLLSKVRVSGGGRCNVTHACFDPDLLVKNYPRGGRELLGPFHRFQPKDTVLWFESRGVKLKVEADGRMFPTTDSSETIIKALLNEANKCGVEIRLKQRIKGIEKRQGGGFELVMKEGEGILAKRLVLATGSGADGFSWAAKLGSAIEPAVPSLFTFNIPTSPLKELSGIAVNPVELTLPGCSFVQRGPLLITHFGFSGPAVLKLSAWAAQFLHEKGYKTPLTINWLPEFSEEEIYKILSRFKIESSQKAFSSESLFKLPKNLWRTLLGDKFNKRIGDIALKDLQNLAHKLHADIYEIDGKTTHKEEFVTCGGVCLKEVNFKTMESKMCPGLFFAGEILDIDGVTGGFNFQNAWTTAFIAGSN